jgi:hypothetical protein
MTLVLLVAPAGGANDGDANADRLAGLPVRGGLRVERLESVATEQVMSAIGEHLARASEPVAIMAAGLAVEPGVLLRVLDDPTLRLAALVASPAAAHPVATEGSTVLSAATASHPLLDPDADGAGLVYVATQLLPAASAALVTAADGHPEVWPGVDGIDAVTATLARAPELPPMTAVRAEPFDAARPGDGFYSTFVLRRISRHITPWAVRHGVSANAVTLASALIGLGGGGLFAVGRYPALVAGAVLLQISIVLDCVDGEIARATRTRSSFGGWLDAVTDRLKEYGALAGLAVAGHHLWTVAAAGMAAQTVRHVQDFAFDKGVLAAWRGSFRDVRPMSDTTPWQRPPGSVAGPEALRGSPVMWARRLVRMPIGERWLVLSVAALADRPWLGLWAYVILAGLAECWTLVGALRRTTGPVSRYGPQMRRQLADYRDDGVLLAITDGRSPAGAGGWLLPPLLTLLEGTAVVACAATLAPAWAPAAFGWFAVVAWHRYDVVYRRGGPAPSVPKPLCYLGGGWLARIVAVLAAAAAGGLPAVLVAGSGWLFVVFVPESLRAGARAGRLRVSAPALVGQPA